MRKFLIVVLVLGLVASVGLSLISCNSDVDMPGSKWTNKEVLEYEMWEGEKIVGALVVTTERVEAGNQTLNMTGTTHNISAKTSKGARVTMVASDLESKVIMASESLLDGFTTIASAKKVDYKGNTYTTKARYDGKRYYYSLNDGEEKKISIKSGFVDNELLYTVIRAYTLENNYSGSYTVIDNVMGEKVKMNISTSNPEYRYNGTTHDVAGVPTTGIKIVSDGVEQAMATNVKCVELNVQRAEAPIGTPMQVVYSVEGEGGLKVIGKGEAGLYSTHIPVMIKENNLTYKLRSIECI